MQSTVDLLQADLDAFKKAGGKYADLARASGVPISTFYKITCRAKTNLRTDTVDKIFHALKQQQ